MFVRLFNQNNTNHKREFLVNLDYISLIEVTYHVPNAGSAVGLVGVTVNEGLLSPDATRWYRFSVGGETFHVPYNSECPVSGAIEKIYRESLKA